MTPFSGVILNNFSVSIIYSLLYKIYIHRILNPIYRASISIAREKLKLNNQIKFIFIFAVQKQNIIKSVKMNESIIDAT